MEDAFGRPDTLLVLGGTSEIGLALAARLAREGCSRIVLGVRDPEGERASAARVRLVAAGAEVTLLAFDAVDAASHEGVVREAAGSVGDLDVVVIAHGQLGDQKQLSVDPVAAAELVQVNFAGAVSAAVAASAVLRGQGHGTLVVLSSVAGVRARVANHLYAATKAGLDVYARGLADSLRGTGVRVLVVRPGFVRTRMTEGLAPQPFATTAEEVADRIREGLSSGSGVVWAPGILRWVFAVLRLLPAPLWRRMSSD